MIVFDLQCCKGHTFEGWFEDNDAYTTQRDQGLLNCPVCNGDKVTRIPSTFAIKSPPSDNPTSRRQAVLGKLTRELSEYVDKNFDNVGSDFAKEALKIHYGVTEPRNIRGVSTKAEEETLQEEGVDFFKMPLPSQSSDNEN